MSRLVRRSASTNTAWHSATQTHRSWLYRSRLYRDLVPDSSPVDRADCNNGILVLNEAQMKHCSKKLKVCVYDLQIVKKLSPRVGFALVLLLLLFLGAARGVRGGGAAAAARSRVRLLPGPVDFFRGTGCFSCTCRCSKLLGITAPSFLASRMYMPLLQASCHHLRPFPETSSCPQSSSIKVLRQSLFSRIPPL